MTTKLETLHSLALEFNLAVSYIEDSLKRN